MNFRVFTSVSVAGPRSAVSLPGGMAGRRQWRIRLDVLVLSASLFLVPAAPVLGVDGVPDHPARLSACVGPALEPAGFRDTEGSFAEFASDCLAHYGITFGTSPEMFSPGQSVTRLQVALFLARAARPAGIELPEASDQGFTDLDFGSGAVNQLAELGIVEGTSSTTFDPYGPVTRSKIALWLVRFLSAAPTGPGGADVDEVEPDDNHFTDLSSVDFKTRTAVRKIYEMGVTSGTSAFTFSPTKAVTRGQMAVFIIRMLAHTHARPVGLIIQAAEPALSGDSDVTVSVSYRDGNHRPRAARLVDVFASTNPEMAFDDAGRCTGHVFSPVGLGRACVVDSSDSVTSPSGYLRIDLDIAPDTGALRIWAWRGPYGAVYDNGAGTATVFDVRTLAIPTALEVTDDMRPTARKLRFDDTVTFTFRLVDADGAPVPKPGVKFSVGVERSRNGRSSGSGTITEETGPDGSVEMEFRHADPNPEPEDTGDIARLDLDLVDTGTLEVRDLTTLGILTNDGNSGDRLLDWSDEKGVITSLTLSVPEEYVVATSEGTGAKNKVRADLTDQYGSGAAGGEAITFTSTDPNVAPNNVERTTNSGGVTTFGYRRDADSGATELITARFGNLVASARQYWAALIPANADGSGKVVVIDPANNRTVLVADANVWLVEYTTADHLMIGDERVRLATFEDALTVGDTLAYQITPTNTPNTYTLTTPNLA
ncbi:MAG: S-layer homology domain-containing protein [bacterium]|nr:S-layer homology domain-containing protein [bacterium]